MQGKKILLAVGGLMTFICSAPALATMSAPYGWYVEGNLGSTRLSDSNYPGSVSSSGIGGNLNVGYKFMPYFAAELGYTRYADTSIKSGSNKAGTVKYYSYDIAGRGILPFSDSGFELFAKLGLSRLNAQTNINNAAAAATIGLGSSQHTKTGVYMGVGGQYYFMPEFGVNVQWQRATGSNATGTMDLFSVGFSFLFS